MSKNSVYSLNNCNAKQANGWIECYKYPSYVSPEGEFNTVHIYCQSTKVII